MRKIDPHKSLMPDFSIMQPQLPTDKPIAQYIRQSSMGQVKKNIQSQIQQDQMFAKRLVKYGWEPENIIKIDRDLGISGQKKQDKREGLQELFTLIATGKIGAIAAFDASRLWRDRTHEFYNHFIQFLKEHDIPVIMFNAVYFLQRPSDEEALREEFRQAAYQLKHVYEKMNPAKLQSIELGQFYAGGCIPIGFSVVGSKGNKHYTVYEPHAALVRCLYKRYRELDGNTARLLQELRMTGFSFPPFEGIEPIPVVALPCVNGFYQLRTRDALVSILTNPAYIGWFLFDGAIVSQTAHEAIVPRDDFEYAFSRLSSTKLDGTPNESKPHVYRTHNRTKALLDDLVYSGSAKAYAMKSIQAYTTIAIVNGVRETDIAVKIATLDKAVTRAILDILVALKYQEKQGLQNELHKQIDALQERKASEKDTLTSQLKGIEQSIKGWQLDKESARRAHNERELDEANKQLNILYVEQDALKAALDDLGKETSTLSHTKTMLEQALEQWQAWNLETKQSFLKLCIERINLEHVTPHILEITIVLKEPIGGYAVGLMFRARPQKITWTNEEKALLQQLYPRHDRLEVLQVLPHRTWASIIEQAMSMGLTRSTYANSAKHIPKNLSLADYTYQQEGFENQRLIAFNKDGGTFWDFTHVGIGRDWSQAMSEDFTSNDENGGPHQVVIVSEVDQLS